MQQKGVVWGRLVFVILLLLLVGQPAAQAEDVTLSAVFASPSGARGALVLTVEVAEAAGESAVPAPGAAVPPATPVPEPGTLILVGLGLLGLAGARTRWRRQWAECDGMFSSIPERPFVLLRDIWRHFFVDEFQWSGRLVVRNTET